MICLPGLPYQCGNNSGNQKKKGHEGDQSHRDPCSKKCNPLSKRKSANDKPGEYTGNEFLDKGNFLHAVSLLAKVIQKNGFTNRKDWIFFS
jgi:hypothetical protein